MFTVHEATPQHLDLVAPLFDAYRQFYRKPPDAAGARAFVEQRLNRQDSLILVAVGDDGRAARGLGFTQLYPSFSSVRMAPIWVLNDLFVAPEARGKGVGRKLMEEAYVRARSAGVLALALATEKTNTVAKALYEDLGYAIDKTFDYYELTL